MPSKNSILEIELQEAFALFREQSALLVQVVAGMITANVAYVGYVFTIEKIELLIIGSIFPLALLIAVNRARRYMTPILYAVLLIERKNIKSNMGVVHNLLFYMHGQEYVEKFLSLQKIKDPNVRRTQMLSLPLPLTERGLFRIAVWLAAVGQFLIGIIYLFIQ